MAANVHDAAHCIFLFKRSALAVGRPATNGVTREALLRLLNAVGWIYIDTAIPIVVPLALFSAYVILSASQTRRPFDRIPDHQVEHTRVMSLYKCSVAYVHVRTQSFMPHTFCTFCKKK